LKFSGKQGAIFNTDGKERYVLWRRWSASRGNVLFIGLNPSNANHEFDDPTTKRIVAHSKRLGFGGCFLMNCFTEIATDPKALTASGNWQENLWWLAIVEHLCTGVVFAWGKHGLVKQMGRDAYFQKRFPRAHCMGINLDGSPKHPLYLPYSSKLIQFNDTQTKSL